MARNREIYPQSEIFSVVLLELRLREVDLNLIGKHTLISVAKYAKYPVNSAGVVKTPGELYKENKPTTMLHPLQKIRIWKIILIGFFTFKISEIFLIVKNILDSRRLFLHPFKNILTL